MSTTRPTRFEQVTGPPAPVTDLKRRGLRGGPPGLACAALLVAAVLAISPLASGYYNFTAWGPLELAGVAIVVGLALAARPTTSRFGLTAATGLGSLLALSYLSMLWAESRESAWTDSNRLALYGVIFAIGVLAIRERRSARAVVIMLGLPALLSSLVLAVILTGGGGAGAFLGGRLDSPIGYVNGTAGLLVMGIWPFLALAESARRASVRSLGCAAAGAIAAAAVTTQSRALIPALLVSLALALIAAPHRTRRAVHLVIVAVAVAAGLHWTLAIYSSTGPTQAAAIPGSTLRGAGLAILAAALIGFAAKLAISRAADRLPGERRARLTTGLGRALVIATIVGVAAIGLAGHTKIAAQWDDFTQLKPEQSAPNRFLDAGGFRYDLWRIAIDEFRAHPIGGVGAGNYDTDYYRLRRNPQSVIQPHSLELQMAAELGIFGLAFLLVFCGAILTAGLTRRRSTLAAQDPMIRVAALGIFSAWLAATSVDWLYDIPGIAGIAILAAAMLVVPGREVDAQSRPAGSLPAGSLRDRRGQAILVVGLGVLALVAASVGRQYAATRYRDAGGRKLEAAPAHAIRTLETAESLDPYSLSTLYLIASAYARLDDYPAAHAAIVQAEQLEPDNYVPPALLGDLAFRRGDFTDALVSYRRAQALDPHEPALANAIVRTEAALR